MTGNVATKIRTYKYPELTNLLIRKFFESEDMWLCASRSEIEPMIQSIPTDIANIVEEELARLHKNGDDREDYEKFVYILDDNIVTLLTRALAKCIGIAYADEGLSRDISSVKLIYTAHLLETLYVKWYGYDKMVDVRSGERVGV